jgi:hypothetical protein
MKQLFFLFIAAGIIMLNGCSKNYNDALPSCSFVSAVPYGQDSILIVGQVTKQGASPVEYNGFAYSNQPNFDITSNQVGCALNRQGLFQAVIPINPDSTYYFKCYVANEYGYTVSGNYKYTVPYPAPDSAPCSLTNNVVTDNRIAWTMFYISGAGNASFGSYGIQASDMSGSEELNIYFNIVPVNGVYTTDGDEQDFIDNSYKKFSVLIVLGNFTQYTVNSGGKVYVAQNKDGTTTLSFCTLTYTAFSTNFPLSGKITF